MNIVVRSILVLIYAVHIFVSSSLKVIDTLKIFVVGVVSIEDDFITWKDKFWPAVCEFFNIEATGEEESVRQYQLTEHSDINPEKVYTGEVVRLHSLRNQRP